VNTFFARDVRALLEAGFDVEIFPIYPLEPALWRYVPDCLAAGVLPRRKIHHINYGEVLQFAKPVTSEKLNVFLRDVVSISASAARFGVEPLAKSTYVFGKAWAWARQFPHNFDHVLAYWGNYAATCAYIFNRMTDRSVPFSMFLHAGTDLYRNQVFLRQKLLYANNIIIVCEFNRKYLRNLYPDIFDLISDNIHLHHLGLDLSEFPYEPWGRQVHKVLGVGGLEKYKGFDYLLHATRELSSRGMNIEVELVGDGKERRCLEGLARKLNIEDQIKFLGWLPPGHVRTNMKQASVLVHPSIGIGDAVPTVIKESMALGTPVIASNVAGIPELLDDGRCGMLVPPRNVEALADAIKILLANPAMRRTYADAARKYAEEHFDLWKNGRCLARLLRSTKQPIEGVVSQEGVLYE
jgi:glycosyltransferase involved in cell wall biosynthesis